MFFLHSILCSTSVGVPFPFNTNNPNYVTLKTHFSHVLFFLLSIGGSLPIVFAYFSEFLSREKRGEHLSWLCMFWMIGGIFASAMAWSIIPHYGNCFVLLTFGNITFLQHYATPKSHTDDISQSLHSPGWTKLKIIDTWSAHKGADKCFDWLLGWC